MNYESTDFNDDHYVSTTSGDSNDITKLVIGALAGAAVGSLVAGAFTEKGVEIRHRAAESGKKVADNLKHKVSGVTDAVANKFEAAKEGAADLIEKGKQKLGMSKGSSTGSSYPNENNYATSSLYESDYSDEDHNNKLLVSAVIAGVAGAIIWSLTTEKGKQTRTRLAAKGKELAHNLQEKASHLQEEYSETIDAAKDIAVDLIKKEFGRSGDEGNASTTGSAHP
ncbi:YtxH domain-containing protein [Segetibacter sp. 3557_3]|uniref:YtxH domain-containing protein n=1 Tax=Segetibacter sp. 3557_3 TaxID=2547429 RepID=UPI001059011E|nr:YtxH domain-containing protein [Segetibacter sp. 3557_3]TDH28557.1 YtxH domain-containing protein [Segetibacter sp. 3557_3]